MAATPAPIPRLAVALIAGGGLAYEVLLLRLFAIAGWHHFAYLAISLALLGFGVAGTGLALAGGRLAGRERSAFVAAAVGFALSAPGGWALAQRLPFNALEIYWDWQQPLWLAGQYLLLLPAFFCVGAAVCLAFQAAPRNSARTYGADLIGSGAGAAALVLLLFWLDPADCLRTVALLGTLAAAVCARRAGRGAALAAAALALLAPAAWWAPQPSGFKALPQQLQAPGAEVIDRRSGPLARLDVVASPRVPVRHAPGMSLASPHAPPEQLALFSDADARTAILQPGDEPPRYLRWLTSALPYRLLEAPRTLVLGAGGGSDIHQARLHGAVTITAVEANPQVLALLRRHGGDVLAGVDTHVADARAFVRRSDARFDLVQLALVGGSAAAAAGVNSLSESSLYTVEAFGDYLDRLAPGGVLAVTRWMQQPPRDTVKAFATAVAALEARGVREPGRHVAMIRGWKTATLLIKREPLTASEREAVRAFAKKRSFDLAHLPGMSADEANRFNRLETPRLHKAAQAVLSPQREAFFADYPFHVRPATDDRPYYFRFFRWELLPELLRRREAGGLSQIDVAYPVLVLTLVLAVLLSAVLILLPLAGRASALRATSVRRGHLLGLCLAVGLGFLFVEIAFIQRFMLILGHPVFAVAVALAGFLVFAGLGSVWAQRLRDGIWWPVAGIAGLAIAYLLALPALEAELAALGNALRVLACLALIAPLAFCMGMPYARALRRLGERDAAVLPWAWGVNGFASVTAAILATLLAVHLGFTALVLIALALYLLAGLCYRF